MTSGTVFPEAEPEECLAISMDGAQVGHPCQCPECRRDRENSTEWKNLLGCGGILLAVFAGVALVILAVGFLK